VLAQKHQNWLVITDATSNNAHQFQGQKVTGQARLLLRLKVYHIYRKEGLGTSKLVLQSSIRYQLARPAKAYEVGLLHAGGGIPCRSHLAATQLVGITAAVS